MNVLFLTQTLIYVVMFLFFYQTQENQAKNICGVILWW